MGRWPDFWKLACARTQMDATQGNPSVIWKAVVEKWRGQGIGAELLRAAEDWARGQGCKEMASDTPIDNVSSQRAHEALGFEVAERSVLYPKML